MNYTILFFILFTLLVIAQLIKTIFMGFIISRLDNIEVQLKKIWRIFQKAQENLDLS